MDLFSRSEDRSEPTVLTVSELTASVKQIIEASFGKVRVIGEISNFRRQSSGHCYFTLKDESALIAAVIFRANASARMDVLRDGMCVLAEGELRVYEARGQYQIVVRSVRPAGEGDLRARFEALKKKLAQERLFDAGRKKPLPKYIKKIILFTSRAGAALQDFLNVLARRAPRTQILLVDVPVQGAEAAKTISTRLKQINSWLRDGSLTADALALIRGGGSMEDLWAFNDEELSRVLADCPVSTVTGIGHETDVTIVDFVADLRAPTPSAAAEMLSTDDSVLIDHLQQMPSRFKNLARMWLAKKEQMILRLSSSFALVRPSRIAELYFQKLDDNAYELERLSNQLVRTKRERLQLALQKLQIFTPSSVIQILNMRLASLAERLQILNPENVLRLGYAWILNEQGRIVKSVREISAGEHVKICLRDGRLAAKIMQDERD